MTGRGLRSSTALLLLAAALACRSGSPVEGRGGQAQAGAPRALVETPSGRLAAVRVEVARTPAEQERGLMFRERLGADEGMLFVFPATGEHSFWMKNTLLPLDMIFIGEDGLVVGVVHDAQPLTTTPRGVGVPSRYVLEVNGGWSAAHGVTRGDRVRFENVPGVR